jgi:predicted dinucleotide-binding enzyme
VKKIVVVGTGRMGGALAAALKGYAGIIVSAMVPGAGGYDLKRDDVTAFASISSASIRDPASGEKPTVFTCAGDEAAHSSVIALAKEIGFASETALRCALM